MMAVDNDSSCEKPIDDISEKENDVNAEDEIDKSELFLLDRCEEKLSETQRKFSGKAKILDKRSDLFQQRSKSKKNSTAAGNNCPFIETLLQRPDLPKVVAEHLLKAIEEFGSSETLESADFILFWTEIYNYVKLLTNTTLNDQNVEKNVFDDTLEVLHAIVALVWYCKNYITSITNGHPLGLTIAYLNALLSTEINLELRSKICEVCEICCIAGVEFQGKFYLDTINFLLRTTLEKKDVSVMYILCMLKFKAELSRVWNMSQAIRLINLDASVCTSLVKYLKAVPKCPGYLSSKEGRLFISFMFARLNKNLIKDFHQSVKDFLPNAKRSQAAAYGQVYFIAWETANTEYRKEIEICCIQNLMSHVFTFPRTSHEMNRLGQNVFEILKHLHNSRNHPQFSKIITELYTPLVWRYLRSGNNIERCNAAEVFLHAYPLEKPGQGMATVIEFQERQQSEMVDLLTDNCHVVRIIAIKGICAKLNSCWNTFPAETIQVIIRILLKDLVNDGSTAEVRRAVYKGLTVMLQNPNIAEYLKTILPQIQENIHDVNEKVRRAFVDMLIKLKELHYPGFRFINIVSVKHLLARLQYENVEVGEPLVNLLMDCIVSEDREQTLLLICKMIVTNPLAARKFFKFSKTALNFEDAVNIMRNILASMRSHVKKKEKEAIENGEKDVTDSQKESVQPKKKRRSSLSVISQNIPEENRQSVVVINPYTLDNPIVSYAMIDIVSILWCLHSKQLLMEENEQKLNDLHNLSGASIPLFLRFYKNCNKNAYFATIHLASLVPLSKLAPTSTVSSACMSQLKAISDSTPDEELEIFVLALCAWNRAGDILELVINCLDQAFRSENLNQSAVPPEGYKSRTVKFQQAEINPSLALKLLDVMFINANNQKRIMSKSYDHFHELLTYISRIKIIAENRVNLGVPLENSVLSDDFIVKCLYRYYKLLIILHHHISSENQPSKTINAAVEMIGEMEWARRIIFPSVPDKVEEEPGICERILQDILKTGRHIIATNTSVDNEFLKKIAEFMRNLLSFGCSLWFVEGSLNVVKFILEYAEAYHDLIDETTILQTTIPVVMSYVFLSLSKHKYSHKVISTCIKHIKEAKFVMGEVPFALYRRYGKKSPVVHHIFVMFITACLAVMSFEIKELQVLDTVDKLNELPYVSTILMNILMSRPLLINNWLTALIKEVSTTFSEDPYMLLSSVSLVHTLSCHADKFPNESLFKVLKAVSTATHNFKPSEEQSTNLDSTTVSDHCSMNVKEISLPVLVAISSRLGCALN